MGTVSVAGAPKREIYVYCDPAKLEAYNLTVESISSLISNENRNVPGGNIDVGSESFALRVEGEFGAKGLFGKILQNYPIWHISGFWLPLPTFKNGLKNIKHR